MIAEFARRFKKGISGQENTWFFALLIILWPGGDVSASSEGPNSPSSVSGNGWKNVNNVFVSDDNRASYNKSFQEILSATSFSFLEVAGIVDGIKVEIEGYGTGANPPIGDQIDLALTKDGSSVAGAWKTAVTLPNGAGNEAYVARGGAEDLWGTTWTPSEVKSSSFGVLIRDTDFSASPLYIDHIRVTVYFTTANNTRRRAVIQRFLSGE
jgi:hypothetical protein